MSLDLGLRPLVPVRKHSAHAVADALAAAGAPPLVVPGGCRVTPAQQSRSAGWLVALAGLLFTARRRKAGRSRR